MKSQTGILQKLPKIYGKSYETFLEQLKIIYSAMDKKYQQAADYYNFHCTGCDNSCCFTRFYHHTLLEYLYIMEGYHTLVNEQKVQVTHRALEVCRKTREADEKGTPVRLMCPLNVNNLCLIYPYRPMICRLHGIPHVLQRPGQGVLYSEGCEVFTEQCQGKERLEFDRTPFYIKMAELEKELKQAVGMTRKIKMTVAQMVTTF
jgi:Fe-S-cluster containining protein